MRKSCAIVQMLAIALSMGAAGVYAADLPALATLAMQAGLNALAAEYRQQTGHEVTYRFDTGPNLARRVASGDAADVLIAPTAVVDQAIKDGRVVAETRVAAASAGIGVGIRRGSARPDIRTVDALKNAILHTDALIYSQGTSGVFVEKMLNDMGIADQIKPRMRQLPSGTEVMERVATGNGNEMGFTMISEILASEPKGTALAGPLPAAVQTYTTYDVAVMTAARAPAAARDFVRFITTPAARKVFAATGLQ